MSNSYEKQPLGGVIIPIVTPFTDAGEIDTESLRAQVRRCIDAGVSAIFAGGSAGSGPLLLDDQWEQAATIVLEETQDTPVRALVGIIETSTARALKQIKLSQQLGADTIVVTPTFYITLQRDAEMIAHFEACRQATDQDMLIYNIPGCTGSSISVSAMRHMTAAGWAVAIKESSGDAAYFRQVLALGAETGVSVLQGNETDIVWSLREGAAGIVPVCANYDPAMFVEIYKATRQGAAPGRAGENGVMDAQAQAEAQARINALRDVLLVGDHNWIAGITWGVHTLGIGNGMPRLPLQPVGDERKSMIEKLKAETVGR